MSNTVQTANVYPLGILLHGSPMLILLECMISAIQIRVMSVALQEFLWSVECAVVD